MPKTIAVLLSGGAGTRLWPLSTEECPKQFMELFGHESLYQKTLKRLHAAEVDELWIVTNERHAAIATAQAAAVGLELACCMLEPQRRDSAAAIAAAIAAVHNAHGPDTRVAIMPCDHLIPDEEAFKASFAEGVALAGLGFIGTFGITPSFPSSEFGYIQAGGAVEGHASARAVAMFHEKPDAARAQAYLEAGDCLWNSGMFIFSAETFAREAALHMPDIWQGASRAVARAVRHGAQLMLDEEAFGAIRKTSIDYGMMEKSSHVAVVPVSFGWTDVGNWAAVHEVMAHAAGDTVTVGTVHSLDTQGCLVIGEGIPVLTSGVSDLLIIATPKGVFVADKSRAADVKRLLDSAKGSV
jgi:mannose-1-phosphate guanylyltransferase/mannose-6-phosphate isomerase